MTIIDEEGGFFLRRRVPLFLDCFCWLIPFISAIKALKFVTCAAARSRDDQFNFEQPLSERKNLTDLKAESPKPVTQKVLMYHARGQFIQICMKAAYQYLASMAMM